MRIDLVVYDAQGKTRGYTRLKLEFGRDLWFVEEDAQRAWSNAGFASSGPFETMGDDVIWLWEREIGNARHNTVVLTDIAMDESDAGQSGTGRIVTGQIGKPQGGTVFWTVMEPARPVMPAAPIELLTGRVPTELAA